GRSARKYVALRSPAGMDVPKPATPDIVYQSRNGSRARVVVGARQTLWSIAKRNKYADVSIQQMLVAIYRANPSAFDGDINSMKEGSTLVMPAHEKVSAIGARWASNWVNEHS